MQHVCVRCTELAPRVPLIHVGELAVHSAARDELGGLDLDLAVELRRGVGVHAAHGHQAAEVGALLVGLRLLRAQLAGGPRAHVARAVDRAVSLGFWDANTAMCKCVTHTQTQAY